MTTKPVNDNNNLQNNTNVNNQSNNTEQNNQNYGNINLQNNSNFNPNISDFRKRMNEMKIETIFEQKSLNGK